MKKSLLNTLRQKSQELMMKDRMYHDCAHINNVYKNAKGLLKKLGGNDTIVLATVLFHDISRDQNNHEVLGAIETRKYLNDLSLLTTDEVNSICIAIERHEHGQVTHEEMIVADADKIDAFTDLGFARGFMMCAKKGMTLKEAIDAYLGLIDKWFDELHFEESKNYAQKNYINLKKRLEKISNSY